VSFLKKLFGGGGDSPAGATASAVDYQGFSIFPEPQREGNVYRLAARITRDVDGVVKEHMLIRADTLESAEAASEAALRKAKQIIDEQGLRLFD